jgi:3-isopropylmalate/(R)-2-methylmalate dehydratase small subunit
MKVFSTFTGKICPLDRANVDTDAIIPKQFLKSIKRSGFGVNLFDEWRYLDRGEPGMDVTHRPKNPDFVLNQPQYQDASILLTRENFGCGSSREHAPWALEDYGFRVIIAPSFADIFFNNCYKNGLLPIVLPAATVDALFVACAQTSDTALTVNLEQQTLTTAQGQVHSFDITEHRKHCLINGLDEIGLTLQHKAAIQAFEAQYKTQQPWLFHTV